MKKMILVFSLMLGFTVSSFSSDYKNDLTVKEVIKQKLAVDLNLKKAGAVLEEGTDYIFAHAVPSESGNIDNYLTVDASADGSATKPYKVGREKSGWLYKTYKTILSFDTSAIPDSATIVYAVIIASNELVGTPPLDWYFYENVIVDIANFSGFGGSTALAGFDYWASAATSLTSVGANPYFDGMILTTDYYNNNRDLDSFINKTGKTQVRISLPYSTSVLMEKLYGVDDPSTNGEATLLVIWE